MKETGNVMVLNTDGFKFARGFKMPDDQNLEDKTLNIVKWGKDNLMPNFYNHIFYTSAYQSGIIRGKVHYITGSGWTPKIGTEQEIDAMFGSWNAQDVLEMISKDYELYNGFALRVIQSIDGTRKLEHIDFDMIRIDIECRGWWYSEDWSKAQQSEEETGLKFYPNFETNTKEFDTIYVYCEKPKNKAIKRSKLDARNEYPEPVYAGALKSLMTDVEIQSFHLYNIINGMKVSGVLNFANGEPPNKTQFEMAVQEALTPTENAGGILINYSDGDERKPSWIPLSNEDLDKRYLTLETSVVQNIMTGHSITSPMLFGIKVSGQLGGTTEMQDSFNIFKRTYVRARQTVIESHLNYLMNGLELQMNEPQELMGTGEISITEGVAGDSKTIQETALNGAQIASLLLIIENYNNGIITRDAAVTIIQSSFPSIPKERAELMVPIQKGEPKMFAGQEDTVLSALLKSGRDRSQFKSLAKNYIQSEDFDFENTEANLLQSFMEFQITDLEAKILDLVRQGEKLDGIINALEDDHELIKKAYQVLVQNMLIVDGEISADGVRELAQNQPEIKLEVVYSYQLRPNAPPAKESRDFCKALMDSNKVFTRSEIDFISAQEDRNVWLYRGGWYSDPTKPRPTPFCRHIWVQELVISNR